MEIIRTPKEQAAYDRYIEEVKKLEDNPNQGLGIYVEDNAEKYPEKIALYFGENSWTWKQFNEEANLYANWFLKQGLKPGDNVALMMENSPEYLFIATGINKIQSVCALVNINLRSQALIHSIKIVCPKYVIIDGDCLPSLLEVMKELSFKDDEILVLNNSDIKQRDFVDLKKKLRDISNNNPISTKNSTLAETAFYIYTSGTTGLPKAVIMTNFSISINGVYYGHSVTQANFDDIILISNPLYHSLSFCTALGIYVYMGATAVLRKKFSASNFWKDIQKYKITFATYVGEIPRYILNQPPSEYEKNHTLKKMLGLGLRKDIWIKFKERFQIEHIFEYYSSTEGYGPIVNMDEVPGMIGRNTNENHALAKINPETLEFYKNGEGYYIKCEPGDVGMSLMKILDIENFTKYRNKEKTNERVIRNVFEDGDAYFITGDLLQLHDNLWLSFADRVGDTFRWKGENVSTLEVENLLSTNESILISAVYGVEIPHHEGKAGMAALKIDPEIGFKPNDISEFVLKVLPKYSIPLFIRIREELEVTGSKKIRKSNLRREGYNINEINEPLYFWDLKENRYTKFDTSIYNKLMKGKIRV